MHRALVAAAALLLASGTLHAREWFKDGRIGAGADVAHQAGMPMGSVALYPASVLVWEDNWGVGLTYPMKTWRNRLQRSSGKQRLSALMPSSSSVMR